MVTPAEANFPSDDDPDINQLTEYDGEYIDPPMLLGLITGPVRTHPDFEITRGDDTTVSFREPRRTYYILVQVTDGQLEIWRWDAREHPPVDDIPKIGGDISLFMDQIEGMGETEEPLGRRFRQVQRAPGTAMHAFDDTEKKIRRHRGNPRHKLDKTGGRLFVENPDYRIPFPAESFAFNTSPGEIPRIRQK